MSKAVIIRRSLGFERFYIMLLGAAPNPKFEYEVAWAGKYENAYKIASTVAYTTRLLGHKECKVYVETHALSDMNQYHDYMAIEKLEVWNEDRS